jgi:hypothetical protein
MGNQNENPVIVVEVNPLLVQARHSLVDGIGKIGELISFYGVNLAKQFDAVDSDGNITTKWFYQTGKLAKGVKTERAIFKAEMVKAGYSVPTVDVYWQRVKESDGYVTAGNKVTATATIDSKTLAELKTMLNRILADESGSEGGEKSQQAKRDLLNAFAIMGGDDEKDLKH